MRADGTKALGSKARNCQWIETLEARPHHPELKGTYALIVDAEFSQSHILSLASLVISHTHTSGPRDVPRCGALSLLQRRRDTGGSENCCCAER
jgi:hypothetical protein